MSKPAGKCVFCGEGGLTKGHVWPDWFGSVLPLAADVHENRTGEFFTFHPAVPGPPKTVRTKQGHAGSRKPRNTCINCNQKWMSGIEGFAKNFTAPLLTGHWTLLDIQAQFAISALMCLIIMRLEFLDPAMRAIPQADRDWLRTQREPAKHWRIWIAQYNGLRGGDHWSRYCGIQIASQQPTQVFGPAHCNTQTTTMVLGRLCVHAFSSTEWKEFDGYEGLQLSRIWPIAHPYINTASMPAVSDDVVLWLHEAVARTLKPYPG
jgi:hypothetical protein